MESSFPAADPPVHLLVAFQQAFPDQALTWLTRAPGREMWVAAARAESNQITIVAPELDGRTTFSLQSAKVKRTVTQRPLPRWARYPAGVTLILGQTMDIVGLNLVFMCGEPAGPRFDYGLGMGYAALWHDVYQQPYTVDTLIEIVDRARREYVED